MQVFRSTVAATRRALQHQPTPVVVAATDSQRYARWFGAVGSIGLGLTTIQTARCEDVQCGDLGEWEEGDIREVPTKDGSDSILVVKHEGKFYATSSKSSYNSFPLAMGVKGKDGTLVSPLHDVAFDIKTGAVVRGPALKNLATYPVKVVGETVVAVVPPKQQMQPSKDADMVKRDPKNTKTIVIVGAGGAGLCCAETLRQEGFTGRIVMVSKEAHAPYDRTVLSKNLEKTAEELYLRKPEWLEQHGIEFLKETLVTKVDAETKTVHFQNGEPLPFDDVLIATGGTPRQLRVPGHDLENICTLRTPEDAKSIASKVKKNQKVVIVGSAFIGLEMASTLKKQGADVTVVGMEAAPLESVLGKKVGGTFINLLREKEVPFLGNRQVVQFCTHNSKVNGVELQDGDVLQADVVILATGITPNVDMIPGVPKADDGSVLVNPFLESGVPHVYAAGDIATFPFVKTGRNTRIEHWGVAMQQGRVAAKNMMGKFVPYTTIPFFWSVVFGKSLRLVGNTNDFDDVIVEGELDKQKFIAYYVKANVIVAVLTMNRDPVAVACGDLMRANKMPSGASIVRGMCNAEDILQMQRQLVLDAASKKSCKKK